MTLNKRPALIAFDLDGTLIDSESMSLRDALVTFHEVFGLTGLTEAFWMRKGGYHGLAGQALLDRIEADFGKKITLQELLGARGERMKRLFDNGVGVAPGLVNVLRWLRHERQTTCICTNSQPERTAIVLPKALVPHDVRLHEYFEGRVFLGIDPTNPAMKPKPAPDVYLKAVAYFGVAAELCVAVEDSPTGVQAAVAAGYGMVVGYSGLQHDVTGYGEVLREAGATHTMRHWDEFAGILEG